MLTFFNQKQLLNAELKLLHEGIEFGKTHDTNWLQLVNVPANELAFIFDGNTILFNCVQVLKALAKLYVLVAVAVAGKYTVCKERSLWKALEKSIVDATVGKLLNLTHASCDILKKQLAKLVATFRDGRVIFSILTQLLNAFDRVVQLLSDVGKVTFFKEKQLKKALPNDVILVAFDGSINSNKL